MINSHIFLAGLLAGMLPTLAAALDLTDPQRDLLRQADVVLLGEVHDNALHHAGQAQLITVVQPEAVVFEMMTPRMATLAAEADRSDPDAFDLAVGWSEAGWPAATLYAPIFEALGDAAIVGAAVPRADVRAAFAEGAATVFGEGAARFGLTEALPDAELAARTEMQFAAHCEAMPREMMGGMVEAQRLRDARFADAALEALDAHGGPVVVIAGHGHVRRDWGMPPMLAHAAPDVTVVSVGFLEEPGAVDDPRFDLVFVTEAAPRGDPCAAFR